jgi:zinc transporter ZupT
VIAAFLRFLLLGVLLAAASAAVLYVVLRWIYPLIKRGEIEEDEAYQKFCKRMGIKKSGKK